MVQGKNRAMKDEAAEDDVTMVFRELKAFVVFAWIMNSFVQFLVEKKNSCMEWTGLTPSIRSIYTTQLKEFKVAFTCQAGNWLLLTQWATILFAPHDEWQSHAYRLISNVKWERCLNSLLR